MLQQNAIYHQLDGVLDFIEQNEFLCPRVLDANVVDGVLVVLINSDLAVPFVQSMLKQVWTGPVEAYCATALMIGVNDGKANHSTA